MPNFTLDGKQLDFKPGQTIIQAANDHGITIAHFCWHPALSVAGNCRICLVEVEKLPKLTIACATQITEGMVVYTDSPKAIAARNAVMEFLLINHPLDCPICDEAGECKLQDYSFKYGVGKSRFDETKNHKEKRIELGPNVMFDQERCISCSRCIRYCEEIVGNPQLTFVNRGEKVTIETFPGKKLDNPYSMNVIEICPVGALTSRDFRFKARVWDMSHTDGICIGCSRGCNMNIWVRNNQIMRLTPRENMEVNQYWMCDHGRLDTFKFVNDQETRLKSPMMRPEESGILTNGNTLNPVDWDFAIARTLSELRNFNSDEIAFIASPYATLEDNFVLKRFASEVIGTDCICYLPDITVGIEDNILIRNDRAPNLKGVELLGIKPISESFIENIISKKIKLAYIIHDTLGRAEKSHEIIKNIEVGIVHLSNYEEQSKKATVIFPATTYAEENGTYVNFQGRVQRIKPAVATIETERLMEDFSVSRLDKFGAPNDSWTKGYKYNARPVWKVISQFAKILNHNFGYTNSEDVFDDITSKIPAFKNLSYEKIGSQGVLIQEKVVA